jgi:hypothetical protein
MSVAARIAAIEASAKANAQRTAALKATKSAVTQNIKAANAATRKNNAVKAANAAKAVTRKNNAANAANAAIQKSNAVKAAANAANAAKVPMMVVHVQNLAGRIETFEVKQDATVGELRKQVHEEQLVEAPLDRVKLAVESSKNSSGFKTLDDDTHTLTSYGVTDDSTVHVVARAVDPGTLIDSYPLFNPAVRICAADDELFYTSSNTKEIHVLRISDKEERTIGKGFLEFEGNDIQVMNDEIFVLDYDKERWTFKTIKVFRKLDGEYLRQFDIRDISVRGTQMCISPNNEIFLRNRNDINVISALNGTLLRTIPNVFSDNTYRDAFCILNGELFSYSNNTIHGMPPIIKVYNPNDGTLSRTFEMPYTSNDITLLGEENTLFGVCRDGIMVLRPSDGFLVHEIIHKDYFGGACVLDNKLFVTIPQKRQIHVYQAGFDIPLSKRNIARRAMLEATMNKVNLNTIQQAPSMVVPIQQKLPAPINRKIVKNVYMNTLEGQQRRRTLGNVMKNFAKTKKANAAQGRIYNNDQKAQCIEKEGREALTLCDSLLQRINEKLARLGTGEMNVQTIGVLRTSVDTLHTHRKEIEDALSTLTGNTRREKDTLKRIEDDVNKAAIRIEVYSKALERTLKGGRRTHKKRRTSRK